MDPTHSWRENFYCLMGFGFTVFYELNSQNQVILSFDGN